MILWHPNPLLGNNCEISKSNGFANKHVYMAAIEKSNRRTVFSVRSVPMSEAGQLEHLS
jgi:hypothetical protein